MAKARAPRRFSYPGNKYAAFHLLLCRWLRHHAPGDSYRYVTLGGTEFRDAISLNFIDPHLLGEALSFEGNAGRFAIATQTAALLQEGGMHIEVRRGNILTSFARESDTPHLFFIDLLGICAFGNYVERFGVMFQDETIREGDCLIITSYLPARVGWPRVYATFDGEFRILGASTVAEKQTCYTRHHPSFTLYRAFTAWIFKIRSRSPASEAWRTGASRPWVCSGTLSSLDPPSSIRSRTIAPGMWRSTGESGHGEFTPGHSS